MPTHNNNYQRWFVNNHYSVAGRPKMEDALMRYAKKVFMHTLIYQADLQDLVANINAKQRELAKENGRLKPVDIRLSSLREGEKIIWLYIGSQNLTLCKVKEEIEVIDPDCPYRVEEE